MRVQIALAQHRIENKMGSTASKTVLVCFFVIAFGFLVFAQPDPSPSTTPQPHGAMELFGMGPELWGNRIMAWTKVISDWLTQVVATIGVLGLALIAVYQNLRKQAINPEIAARLDRQGERIDNVALAVSPPITQTVQIDQPLDHPIPVVAEPPKTP